jgi:hypothetical protein
MTNPKPSESDTEKNPWAMVNTNYKFGKSLLSDGDLKKAAPFTRKLHTFYMQRGKSDDDHGRTSARDQCMVEER